jgi:hypothetical protein
MEQENNEWRLRRERREWQFAAFGFFLIALVVLVMLYFMNTDLGNMCLKYCNATGTEAYYNLGTCRCSSKPIIGGGHIVNISNLTVP